MQMGVKGKRKGKGRENKQNNTKKRHPRPIGYYS